MTSKEAAYVPKKGDIVKLAGSRIGICMGGQIGDSAPIFKLIDFAGTGTMTGIPLNIELLGLSLERIKNEYVLKDDANIREIMAYEAGLTEGYNTWGVDERIKRDEKLIEAIIHCGIITGWTLDGARERLKKVFAEVDKGWL